jgi:hypothetical protein
MNPELLEPFARTIVGALGAGILESGPYSDAGSGAVTLIPLPQPETN